MKPIWVVDDDASIRWVLEKALAKQSLECRVFESADRALAALRNDGPPAVLISDIRMPGRSGFELLEQVKQEHPELPVIIMTAYSDLDSAVTAFQGGAFEYLTKPFDIDAAIHLIRRALSERLQQQEEPRADAGESPEILGHAPAMQEVFRAIGRLSQSTATVLITGESGSGKELVASALHRHSARSKMPFVALNTAAIPKDLLESELFGHERGSFTGAQSLRRGRFEQAEGGTLFLDEIGDMPIDLQTRLLRVLSDGHYYRVGGHQPIRANVRVVAATHQNLERAVADGRFREDLFHRLNVIRLRLPPLRERAEDIPVLARYFLSKYARELNLDPKKLADETLAFLMKQPFPGNVRQLENLCHWMTVMAPASVVAIDDLPQEMRASAYLETSPAASVSAHESPGIEATETLGVPVEQGGESTLDLQGAGRLPTYAKLTSEVDHQWRNPLQRVVEDRLQQQDREGISVSTTLMDDLTRAFESAVIGMALKHTRGRRIEAAQRLGIGRNTITRKIAELKLEAKDH